MTTLVIEQFAAADSDRAIRRLELTRRRAAEELAGRTVWCVSSVRAGRRAADALRRRLRALPDDGLASRGIRMREGQTLTRVTENGDALLGSEVRAGDVVVLHDPIAAALADAVRARGAHAIWWLPAERLADAADEAWALAHCTRPRVDAYVTAWQIALDDFGTGFGTFTYLKRLPITFLKVDVDFVRDLATNRDNQPLVRAIVGLASDFGYQTIAEGVEDAETLALVKEYGVNFAQGFYLGRPAPIDC